MHELGESDPMTDPGRLEEEAILEEFAADGTSLRVSLEPAIQNQIDEAKANGRTDDELIVLFGEANMAAYWSNPYNQESV